jgi:hypothetical protein
LSRSCLYEGIVRHRRFSPVAHEFSYRIYLAYLDLDDPGLDRLWPLGGERLPALAWHRRADYLGGGEGSLADAVRDLVARELGRRPAGPLGLCTHLRQLGTFMNPVSFFYCHDAGGALDAIVAEVSNTPWDERHRYVLDARAGLRFRFPKAFHVSPFLDMGLVYDWRFTAPGEKLGVHMACHEGDKKVFDASLTLARVPLTRRSLAAALVRFPAMSARVLLAIYWQALRLWIKGAPFFSHPTKRVSA